MFSSSCVATKQLRTKTFSASETWPVPLGVVRLEKASGYGARGTSEKTTTTYTWNRYRVRYYYTWSGKTEKQLTSDVTSGTGRAPRGDYCDPIHNYAQSDPDYATYIGYQDCYEYQEYGSTSSTPAKPGTPTTGFGLTFPGSATNVPQTTTTVPNVAVTPGAPYDIVVPAGGTLTITYFQ